MNPPELFSFDIDSWQREPLAAFDSFLSSRRINGRKLRPASFTVYRGMLERLLQWLDSRQWGLPELGPEPLDSFLQSRQLGPETRHRYLLIFTELYQHLALLREDNYNPARELLIQQRSPDRHEPEALTPAEVTLLLQMLPAAPTGWKDQRLIAMVSVSLGAGLRPAELLGLRLSDLVRRDSLRVRAHKPRPERAVPLQGLARDSFELWSRQHQALGIPGDLLFPGNMAGAPLAASTMFRQVQALLKKAGVSRRYEGAILLRNTCAASWLSRHPLNKVQFWLGHELERSTSLLLPAAPAWSGSRLLH